MKIARNGSSLTVVWEPGDVKVTTESQLLYHIKKEMNRQGYDLIKKRMWEDGHMVDDHCQYLRDRKGEFAIWDDAYAVRSTVESLKKYGEVTFSWEEFKKDI